MITQYEVSAYLVEVLPEIEEELKKLSVTKNIFKTMRCLARYTCGKVKQHDLKTVKKCFEIGDNIYAHGNFMVRNAIEKVFVRSFSSLMKICCKNEKKQLHAIIPLYLYTAYVQHELKCDKATGKFSK